MKPVKVTMEELGAMFCTGGRNMKSNREFSEESIIARIQDRAGIRYQSAQLAAYFGVPTARMTVVLTKLCALKQIRIVRCPGNPTMYYLPSKQELEAEERLAAKNQNGPAWDGIVRSGRVKSY